MDDLIISSLFRENQTALSTINFITEDTPCQNIDVIAQEFNKSMIVAKEAMIKIDKYELENAQNMSPTEYKVFTEKSVEEIKTYIVTKAKEFWEKIKEWYSKIRAFISKQLDNIATVLKFLFNLDWDGENLDFSEYSLKWFNNDSKVKELIEFLLNYTSNGILPFTKDSVGKLPDNPSEDDIINFYKMVPDFEKYLKTKFVDWNNPSSTIDLRGSVFISSKKEEMDKTLKWLSRDCMVKLHPDKICNTCTRGINDIEKSNVSPEFLDKARRIFTIYNRNISSIAETTGKVLNTIISLYKKLISDVVNIVKQHGEEKINSDIKESAIYNKIESDILIREYYDEFNSLFINEALALPAHAGASSNSNNNSEKKETPPEETNKSFFNKIKDSIVKFCKILSEKIKEIYDKAVKFIKEKWEQFKTFLSKTWKEIKDAAKRAKLFATYNSKNPKANNSVEIKVFGSKLNDQYNEFKEFTDKVLKIFGDYDRAQITAGIGLSGFMPSSVYNKQMEDEQAKNNAQSNKEVINSFYKDTKTLYDALAFDDISKKSMTIDEAMKRIEESIKVFEESEKKLRVDRNRADGYIVLFKARAADEIKNNTDFAEMQISWGKFLRIISLACNAELRKITIEYNLARSNAVHIADVLSGNETKNESYIEDLLEHEHYTIANEAAGVIKAINEEVEEVMNAAINDNNAQGIERISKAKADTGSVSGDPDKLTYDDNCYSQTNKIGTENIAGSIGLDNATDTKTTISLGNPTKAVEEAAYQYFARDFI